MGGIFSALKKYLAGKEMEIVLLGLDNGGKTTLMQALTGGDRGQTIPTVGLSVKEATIGDTKIKCWDIGGQTQFRPEWGRYANGCHAVLFVVDTTDSERMFLARHELHILLDQHLALHRTPILIVANKVDLDGHLSEVDLVNALNLDYITENEWKVIGTSALTGKNVDRVAEWLIATSQNVRDSKR
eukprot:TRINITY_DN17599_c0_g1_i1.p1 TRINITY_DN17599_c0_g1~~TRINITY_DN17599_c0_g1_i1.p1  ORF type:complete len:186 (-),score=42.35 TRINITY_DN17599_c0_g1_i1:396-953(-)